MLELLDLKFLGKPEAAVTIMLVLRSLENQVREGGQALKPPTGD